MSILNPTAGNTPVMNANRPLLAGEVDLFDIDANLRAESTAATPAVPATPPCEVLAAPAVPAVQTQQSVNLPVQTEGDVLDIIDQALADSQQLLLRSRDKQHQGVYEMIQIVRETIWGITGADLPA